MHPIAEKYLRKSALPTIFCPGCGHGIVLNSFLRVVDEMDIIDDLSLVGGIGCSSWLPVFVDTDVIHTLHGRAIALATGLKLANPKRTVVAFCGDGDCIGIGGNHFLHGCRRNIDITVVMMDNQIYGMTGGQLAPTTPFRSKTQTSPYGNPEMNFDACKVAIAAGATYVARWTCAHPKEMARAIKEGIEHKGFSFIEIISPCPTQAGRYIYGMANPGEMLNMFRKNSVRLSRAEKMSSEELARKVAIGKLYEEQGKPELSANLYAMMKSRKECIK